MWITSKKPSLLIIGGGILQEQTLSECDSLKLDRVLVDGNKNCYCTKSPYYESDNFIHANIKDPEFVLSQFKKWYKKHTNLRITGVYTQGCDCAYTVAYVAKKLGLPSIGLEAAYKASNKFAMRSALDGQVRQPKFRNLTEFPVVVKPTDNCASRGITIVRDKSKLEEAIWFARNFSTDGKYLVEEFIDGKEYSVDTIVYKGKVYPAGISDRVFLEKNNYAIQDGSATPSLLPAMIQEKIYWTMQDCADVLGISWGALKGDLIVKDNGVYVLEVTPRLSGGFDSQFRKPYSFGINLIKATIDLACGKSLDFDDIIPRWVKFSQTFTVFPKEGIIKEIRGIEELKKVNGVKHFFITKNIGERVDYKNCADRVIHIIACRDTYEQLQETIRLAKQTINFITE